MADDGDTSDGKPSGKPSGNPSANDTSRRRKSIGPFSIISTGIYSNPKIRRAGRDGRDVYMFTLSRNAERGRKGFVPASDLAPDYVADMLRISEQEATEGLQRAVTAGLLAIENDTVWILGWDDTWARASVGESEARQLRRLRGRSERDPDEDEEEMEKQKQNKRSPAKARTRSGQGPDKGVFGPLSPAMTNAESGKAMKVINWLASYTSQAHATKHEQEIVVRRMRAGHSANNLIALIVYTCDPGGLDWYDKFDQLEKRPMRGHCTVSHIFSDAHIAKYMSMATSDDAWDPEDVKPAWRPVKAQDSTAPQDSAF